MSSLALRPAAKLKAQLERLCEVGYLRNPELMRKLEVPGEPAVWEIKVQRAAAIDETEDWGGDAMSDWFKSTNESEAMLAEERLVLSATEAVYSAMDRAGVTKKELAELLDVRPTEVSQRLNGRRNLTLRTLARMLHVLGEQAEISVRPNTAAHHVRPTVHQQRGAIGPVA